MALRCPLCLENLKPNAQLLRFCVTHADTPERITPYQRLNIVQCPKDRASSAVEEGVFLLHVGCSSRNMFWDEAEQKVIIPNPVTIKSSHPKSKTGELQRVPVDHWIIPVLRQITMHTDPGLREMWFPEVLFRAANGQDGNEHVGVLVMMVGAKASGKTVFSTMAVAQRSYSNRFHAEHFVHITRGGGQESEELLRVLQVLENMRKTRGTADPLPASQEANIGNIKSVHLSLSEFRRDGDSVVFSAGGFLWDTIKIIFAPSEKRSARKQRVVAFYDVAGEKFERSLDLPTASLGTKMDVLAIFIDATSVTGAGTQSANCSTDSVWVANDHLHRTKSFSGRRCIVVTKLDQITRDGVKSYLKAEDEASQTEGHKEREILLGWLSGDCTDAERELARQIKQDPSLRVFFVWTVGIGDPSRAAKSYGITSFVLWCLQQAPQALSMVQHR